MGDEQQNPRRERDKLIDVTKPRKAPTPPPQSNVDASRISAHTLREQQALEKLKKQVGTLDQRESRMKGIKTGVAIVLILILIAIAIIFIMLINKSTQTPEEEYDIRLSVKIDGKGNMSYITDTGTEKLNAVYPGDTLDLSAYVRNSNVSIGEAQPESGYIPPNIFVRFKIVFILDYVERYDVLLPEYDQQMWHRFNKLEEDKLVNGIKEDDNFYYYNDSLGYLDRAELFSSLQVIGESLTCNDGGKYGQIQVIVESIEANLNNLQEASIWPTAPRQWVINLIKGNKA